MASINNFTDDREFNRIAKSLASCKLRMEVEPKPEALDSLIQDAHSLKRELLLNHWCKIRDELEDYVGKMLLMANERRENILNNMLKLENVMSGVESGDKGKRRGKERSIAEEEEEVKEEDTVTESGDSGVGAPVRKKPRQAQISTEYRTPLPVLKAMQKSRAKAKKPGPGRKMIIILEEEEREKERLVMRRPRAMQAQKTMQAVPPLRIPLCVSKAYREGNVNAIGGYLKWIRRYTAEGEALVVDLLGDNESK